MRARVERCQMCRHPATVFQMVTRILDHRKRFAVRCEYHRLTQSYPYDVAGVIEMSREEWLLRTVMDA